MRTEAHSHCWCMGTWAERACCISRVSLLGLESQMTVRMTQRIWSWAGLQNLYLTCLLGFSDGRAISLHSLLVATDSGNEPIWWLAPLAGGGVCVPGFLGISNWFSYVTEEYWVQLLLALEDCAGELWLPFPCSTKWLSTLAHRLTWKILDPKF